MRIPRAIWSLGVVRFVFLLFGVWAAFTGPALGQGAKTLELEVRLFTTPDVARA